MPILSSGYLFWDGFKYITTNTLSIGLGGDISGTTTSAIVTGLQGRGVSSIAPTNGFVLSWNPSQNSWIPTSIGTIAINNPTLSQATWFIDPANSTGLANDSNSGIDANHPVLSYNGGIVTKWGTNSPLLRQNTTLTWMSSQPSGGGDPVIFTPIMANGAVATITGTLGASQQVHSGSFTSVTAKNRGTQTLLSANLGFAASAGQLVQNTTSGKSSYAWVYKLNSGTTFFLSQPIAPD
jgi:hypothetical protein